MVGGGGDDSGLRLLPAGVFRIGSRLSSLVLVIVVGRIIGSLSDCGSGKEIDYEDESREPILNESEKPPSKERYPDGGNDPQKNTRLDH